MEYLTIEMNLRKRAIASLGCTCSTDALGGYLTNRTIRREREEEDTLCSRRPWLID